MPHIWETRRKLSIKGGTRWGWPLSAAPQAQLHVRRSRTQHTHYDKAQCYFNAFCTDHLSIHRQPSCTDYTCLIYKPVLCIIFTKMPPPRKCSVCLTHLQHSHTTRWLEAPVSVILPFSPPTQWNSNIIKWRMRALIFPTATIKKPSPSSAFELSDTLHDADPWGKHMFAISMIPCGWWLEVIILTGATQSPLRKQNPSKVSALSLVLLLQRSSDIICFR